MIISDLLVSLSYSSSSVRRLSLLLSARGGLALGQRNSHFFISEQEKIPTGEVEEEITEEEKEIGENQTVEEGKET